MERLQKVLAQAGLASRRAAEQIIWAGRVRVDGKIVRELGTQVDPRKSKVEVDGNKIVAEKLVYIVLHKPRGVVCTLSDPEGRPTIRELLKGAGGRVVPVGRLDFHTSGALLCTNDGEFAQALAHPKQEVPKVYVAKVKGTVDDDALPKFSERIEIDGRQTRAAQVRRLRYEGDKTWLEITLREGRNRQVRRLGEATGFPVMRLARISHAGVTSEDLRPGQWRPLTIDELVDLKKVYGVPKKVRAPHLEPLPKTAKTHGRPLARPDIRGEAFVNPTREARASSRGERGTRGTAERDLEHPRGAKSSFGEREGRGAARGAKPSFGERGARGAARGAKPSFGEREGRGAARGAKPSFGEREGRGAARGAKPSFGEREARGAKPSFGEREGRGATRGAKPSSFGEREARGAKPSFGEREGRGATRGAKPSSFGEREGRGAARGAKPSFGERAARGAKPSFGEREARGAKPSFGEREARGAKPSFGEREGRGAARGAKPSFGEREGRGAARGAKPSFGEREARGAKPSFGEREGRGAARGAKPSFGEREARGAARGAKPSFGEREARGAKPPAVSGGRGARSAPNRTEAKHSAGPRFASGDAGVTAKRGARGSSPRRGTSR